VSFGRRIGLAIVTVTALALSACGTIPVETPSTVGSAPSASQVSGGQSTGGQSASGVAPTPSADFADRLPGSIKAAGVIKVATDASRAPAESGDGSMIIGFDIDLFNAVAAEFGVTADYTNTKPATIIPGITSGQFDIGVSSLTISADQLKSATMISYFTAGTQWATKKGNPSNISIDTPCGLTIAVQKDTAQVDDLTSRQQVCGNRPIKIKTYDDLDAVAKAVENGTAAAMVADSPSTGYAVQQSGDTLEALGDIYDAVTYGYALPLSETDFASAIADALQQLKADGTYEQILTKWGVQAGAVDAFAVNPTT